MPKKKGTQKTGGRKAGTPNKTTTELREAINLIISDNIDTLNDDIQSLAPKDRIKFIIDLVNYVLPKFQSMELKEPDRKATKPDVSKVTIEELEKVREIMQRMYPDEAMDSFIL